MPKRPGYAGAILPCFDEHCRHGVGRRAEALKVFVVGEADHGERPEVALRNAPLHGAGRLLHGVPVVTPGRIVQGTVHEDIVGGSAGDRVDGESDGARQLAVALETGSKPRIHAEVLRQPGGRHGADAVFNGVVAGGGKQGTRREAVNLVWAQAGIGDCLLRSVQGEDAQRAVRMLHDVALGVADDCDTIAGQKRRAHASVKAGTAMSGARSSNATRTRLPRAKGASGPSSRRPMRRTSDCSSRATSTNTSGSSVSKPGRKD